MTGANVVKSAATFLKMLVPTSLTASSSHFLSPNRDAEAHFTWQEHLRMHHFQNSRWLLPLSGKLSFITG